MTKANIRESVIGKLGAEWVSFNQIENNVIDDMIVDEYEELIGKTMLLEGTYTGTGDGTNPYIEVPDKILLVKRVHYDYTSGSDEGDLLTEISPMEFTGEYTGEDPEYYWLQGMHRVDRQRIYFNEIPSATKTIRALFYKFPDDISSDTAELEIKRLWAKAVKHIVTANVALMGRNMEQCNMRKPLHNFELEQYMKTMKTINSIPKYTLGVVTTQFSDA